jgi:hypothetical protein
MNFKWLKLTGVQALLATQAEPALQSTPKRAFSCGAALEFASG